jgi:peptidoglycan/xylan/chitin deacetylase (PgdA/CDA1 family)
MKTIIFFFFMLPIHSLVWANFFSQDHFPKDDLYIYSKKDVGMGPYLSRLTLSHKKKVVLTFDDGPHPTFTAQILDILKKYDLHATFFVNTYRLVDKSNNWIPSAVKLVKRMYAEGHIVASHNHVHDDSKKSSQLLFEQQVEKSLRLLESIEQIEPSTPQTEVYFRFPYGNYGEVSSTQGKSYHHLRSLYNLSQKMYGENCINFVFWDIDPVDWATNITSDQVTSNIMAVLEGGNYTDQHSVTTKISRGLGGGIILMHDIQRKNLSSLLSLINELSKKSYEVVPLYTVQNYEFNNLSCLAQL